MTIELQYLLALIGTAERRLAFQAGLVAKIPDGCASKQAVSACEVLQAMSDRVIALRLRRETLVASIAGKTSREPKAVLSLMASQRQPAE